MRNYTLAFFYKTVLIGCLLLLPLLRAVAQVDISIGNGTGTNSSLGYPCPLQDYYEGSRAQYLILASELTAAGMAPGNLSAVRFTVNAPLGTVGVAEQYTMKIGTTTLATLDMNSWVSGTNTVYGPVDYQPVVGVNTITFTVPFFWNGTDNLVLEICNGASVTTGVTTYTNNPLVPYTTNLGFNASHTTVDDDENSLCGTAATINSGSASTRPNMVFVWTPASPCTGTPNGGTAVTNMSTVCMGSSFMLRVTGATVASGLTYQWQSSANGTTWTDIPGATTPSYTGTQSATTQYRCKVTCTGSGASATSTSVQVSSPVPVSGTFTINKNLPTGGTNFASFNDAYQYLKCGINGPVIFNVTAGTGPYNEQLILQQVPGASAANTITFNGNGDTLAFRSTNSGERAVIKLDGADYFRFNNLAIKALGTGSDYGVGVQLLNDANNNVISGCKIYIDSLSSSSNYAGIVISSSASSYTSSGDARCDSNTISNNHINGGYYGIVAMGSSTVANMTNKFTNNTIRDFYNYGIYLGGSFNALVEGNTITRPTRSNVSAFYGIYLTILNTKTNISKNRIHNPFGGSLNSTSTFYGIYFSSVDALSSLENIVSNNLVYNLTGNGDAYGIYNSSSDNVWYYHNTLAMDGTTTSSNSYVTRGFYQTSQADGVEFVNNLITISRGGVSKKHAVYFAATGSTIHANRNNYFLSSTTGEVYTGYYGANQATLLNWQTASKQDTNAIASNPIYASIASGNYRPTNASMDNRGGTTFASITTDIENITRNPTTPDIGAYEFTPGPCVSPPVAGSAGVNQTPVCVNTMVSFNLTGNSMGLGQTYQWQRATVAAGPFANVGNVLNNPDTTMKATATGYYRVAVTCSGNTSYSDPVLLTVTPALPGGTYVIDKNSTNPAEFKSFAQAGEALKCGIAGPVIMNVKAASGPYNEQFILDSIAGTSAVNTITFKGNGNTIRYSSSNTDERAVIKLRRTDYVTFDSLIVDANGTGSYGWGIQFTNDADHNRILNCSVVTSKTSSSSSSYAGIVINGSDVDVTGGVSRCDSNIVHNNKVSGGYYGISVTGSNGVFTAGNKITSNKVTEFYSYGITTSYTSGLVIEGNQISRPTRTNFGYANYGIYILDDVQHLLITRNTMTNLYGGDNTVDYTSYFIYSSFVAVPQGEIRITNNKVYKVGGGGDVYGVYNYNTPNMHVLHNTFSFDDAGGTAGSDSYGFYLSSQPANIRFFDNIVTVRRGGTGNNYGFYNSSSDDVEADYNDYYINGGSGKNYIGYYGGNQPTLAAWKASAKVDSNSLNIDPIYADLPNGNLAPVISPMDNSGTPVGVTVDINNATRSTTKPDIGAYEISLPPCQAPPVPGTAVPNPSTGVCIGTIIDLNLNGNSTGGNQTYQWYSAKTATGPWAPISDVLWVSNFRTELTTSNYYRCRVICGSDTAWSVVGHVNMNNPLAPGIYSINPAAPASATNFQSFAAVVSILDCGIAGTVIFRAVPGTYAEQIRMHKVPGAGPGARVIFESGNNNAASVILTNAGTSAANYTLKLDSASFITWKTITIAATGTTYGRAIELAGPAAYDTIQNCIISMPAVTTSSTNVSGIYASQFRGKENVFTGNTIRNGAYGIYFSGFSETVRADRQVIDSNIITRPYAYGIYTDKTTRIVVNNNRLTMSKPLASTSYGIYATLNDSAFRYTANQVKSDSTGGTHYGLHFNACVGSLGIPGYIGGNKVYALSGNTSALTGIFAEDGEYCNYVNNVISIKTTGSSSYGLRTDNIGNTNFTNNSVLNASASSGNNAAGYFYHTYSSYGNAVIRNNIFAQTGGGNALYVYDPEQVSSDYNMLYTSGTNLVRSGAPATYTSLQAWRDAAEQDYSSMVYKPAFISETDLQPNVADPEVWAIHGRGVQVAGNNKDINGAWRPTLLKEGVPDMGAYEFVPTSVPPVLPAIPAAPAPGITQTFTFGTDTVTRITWKAGAPVPPTVTVKRYSGMVPPGLAANAEHMYFYTDVDVTGADNGKYKYDLKQYFVDSWQGLFRQQTDIRLGRTDTASKWLANNSSTVDEVDNVIADTSLSYIDKFTGLLGNNIVRPPVSLHPADSSNRGTRFWVGYGHHQFFGSGNSQGMVLYLSAEDSANVTVRINGTSWIKRYRIPANSVITSDLIPKSGLSDARLLAEGLSERGISIEADTPIVAYAHIYGSASSGATMLLPVGTYGYDYYSLNSRQNYGTDCFSWFYAVAEYDNTALEIIPAQPTVGGRTAGTPFTVVLNRGQVYQVLGALKEGATGYDLTGSHIRSIPNSEGRCWPVAVFSGSSRTAIDCDTTGGSGSGDNLIQQNFPSQAWGKRYLTAPTSVDDEPSSFMTNVFRVVVKDPATVVKRNGVALTGLLYNRFYEFNSGTADFIEADQPVMVAQYMSSSGNCDNTSGHGDPEMIYISPIEQGIKKIGLYRNTEENISVNYLTLIIPAGGLTSLRIDGSNVFDHVYDHNNMTGYKVVVKRWDAASAQCTAVSDSAFTAITYGLGSVESYGYNAGTLVKNLNILPAITNVHNGTGNTNAYTCAKTPFRFTLLAPVKPTSINWQLSKVTNLTPNADVLQDNPTPIDSVTVNGRKYFKYTIPTDYVFSQPGTYYVPIIMKHPDIESCGNSFEGLLPIKVVAAPVVNFDVTYSGCLNDVAQFRGMATTATGNPVSTWKWQFGDNTTSSAKDTTKKYLQPGKYNVKLSIVASEGCIGDTTKEIDVHQPATVELEKDSMTVCTGTNPELRVKNPQADVLYNWYDAATGGNLLHTGTTYTINNISAGVVLYVGTVRQGCPGLARARAVIKVLPVLATPVVTVDSVGTNMVRFKWNAVPNATGYEVSLDNGATWSQPSSGPNGLFHIVGGLRPVQTVTLIVKAKGCEDKQSVPVPAQTLPDGVYIPNAFTPNGDGLNDELKVYGYVIREIQLMIFNQWGEKIFESNTQSRGWDGNYKGKAQPSGVYIYVCKMRLADGSTIDRKGAINLMR